MNYILMPSLQRMANVSIATALWKKVYNGDVIKLLPPYSTTKIPFTCSYRAQFEALISKNVAQLSLPIFLPEGIRDVIQPMVMQIYSWVDQFDKSTYNDKESCSAKYLTHNICWTSEGRIDHKKTTEQLLDDNNLSLEFKYRLACKYCLEDRIPVLWMQLADICKEKHLNSRCLLDHSHCPFLPFWTCYMHTELKLSDYVKKIGGHIEYSEYTFSWGIEYDNIVAARCLWKKFPDQIKNENIIKCAVFSAEMGYTSVLLFLLSQMSKEQQVEIFKNRSYYILRCFLEDWLCNDIIIPTLDCGFVCFDESYNGFMLYSWIVSQMSKGEKYREIFRKLWVCSPSHFKTIAIEETDLLSRLFCITDIESIALVLKEVTVQERNKIIYSRGVDKCIELIRAKKWGLLKTFAKGVVPDDEINNFKKVVANEKGGSFFCHLISPDEYELKYCCLKEANGQQKVEQLEKESVYSEVQGKENMSENLLKRSTSPDSEKKGTKRICLRKINS